METPVSHNAEVGIENTLKCDKGDCIMSGPGLVIVFLLE